MPEAYIGMGSNMGNKMNHLQKALDNLGMLRRSKVLAVSSVYRTAPVGYTEQDWFLNAAVRMETALEPEVLMQELLAIESRMGRVRTVHWGPRIIDLDLLLYGQEVKNLPDLILPHPRIAERAFVLVPLLELDSQLSLPDGKRLQDCLQTIDFEKEVQKISENLVAIR